MLIQEHVLGEITFTSGTQTRILTHSLKQHSDVQTLHSLVLLHSVLSHPLNSQSFTSAWDTPLTVLVQKDLNHLLIETLVSWSPVFSSLGSDRVYSQYIHAKVISQVITLYDGFNQTNNTKVVHISLCYFVLVIVI